MAASDRFHDDEIMGKVYDRVLVVRLLRYLYPYRRLVVWAFVLQFSLAIVDSLVTYLPRPIFDRYVAQGDREGLLGVLVLFAAGLLVVLLLEYGQFMVVNLMSQRAMRDLRNELFGHLEHLSLKFFNSTPVGRVLTRLTSDVEALDGLFANGVVNIAADMLRLVALAGLLLYLNWVLALVTFAVLPLVALVSIRFKMKVRYTFREVRRWLSNLNGHLQEQITGMATVQAFAQEEKTSVQFEELNHNHTRANIAGMRHFAIFFPTVDFLGAAVVVAILGVGSYVLPKTMGPGEEVVGTLFVFVWASQKFMQPIRDLADKFNILQAAMAASERIFKLMDTHEFIPVPEVPRAPEGAFQGRVEFEDVWFAYKEEEWVLRGVNFHIEPGQRVAFVGATGAGKSTIINLLLRFYDPQRGRILVDGVDLREMDLSVLRGHIGLVLQDVFLFSGDITSNIRLDRQDISDERVREACELVRADRFIQRLPETYHEEVKERGATLSVGQRQLLSFARALAYNPSLLLLDEATSSIDTETEALIVGALENLMEGRTSLVIAHRLSTIQHADQILVLHLGEIVERGTHQELLAEGGVYFRLYQLQYKDQLLTGTDA